MEQKTPGIMIAAVRSGSGKTTITCALLEALKERGLAPQAFKCGPDYIDPLFHREIIGVPSKNLDRFFADEGQLREIYSETMKDKGIAVVEGAMGLYDGLGGIREEGSAYHVACILGLPILLVVDAHGMGYSILALLSGFLQYDNDREKRIAGVLLNKTSAGFYQKIAPVIETELQVPVLGFVPKQEDFSLESRHLGLKLPNEVQDLQNKIQAMANTLEKNVAVDRVIEMAENRTQREQKREEDVWDVWDKREVPAKASGRKRVKLGVARDEAFCFYYEENLKLLEEYGAELVYFSPLHDPKIPEKLDALLLCGGYPEVYARQLEKNGSMRSAIRRAILEGMPSVAECGGFMYLHRSIEDESGGVYQMCGVLPGKCVYSGKLVRFGYVELTEKKKNFLGQGGCIKGHEFHYYDSEENGQDCLARKPVTGSDWECVIDREDHFWGFPHLYYLSNPDFVKGFISKAQAFCERRDRL